MKIQKIKKLSNQKYRIELSNGSKLTTYDEVILKHQLLFHKELHEEEYDLILKETTAYDHYYKALKQISVKLRSKHELTLYLKKLELSKEEQTRILKELEEKGYLNDERYAKAFVSDRIHLSEDGPYQIKKVLLEHKIEESLIDSILSSYEEEVFSEKLKARFQKRARQNQSSRFLFEQKMRQEGLRLGYSNEMIEAALPQIEVTSSAKKEAQKMEKRLSKKYQGETLLFEVQKKLYQKGYSQEEIKEAIQK